MRRTKFGTSVLCAILVLLCLSHRAISASLVKASQYKRDGLVGVRFEFDSLPKFSVRELDNPPRLELLLLETSALNGKISLLEKSALPILKVTSFFGGQNLSISIHLVGKVPHFIKEEAKALSILFPENFSQMSKLMLSPTLSLNIERILEGGRYLEIYYTKTPPERVGQDLKIIGSAELGGGRLSLSQISERAGASLAFNAGFFDGKGNPVGLLIVNGKLLALPSKGRRASLIIDNAGKAYILRPNLSFWLEVDGKKVRVDGFNQPMTPGKVLLYNHLFPREKLDKQAIFFKLAGDALTPISYEELARLEMDAIILAETLSPEADPFKGRTQIKFRFALTDETGKQLDVRDAVEGAPMLIEDGVVKIDTAIDELSAQVREGARARTAVGIDKDGGVIIFVAKEDKELGVKGLTLEELARKLLELGAVDALNLDGGGSSAICLAGIPLNLDVQAQRLIPSAILIGRS